MHTDKKRLGQIGEDLAARYLAGLGYTVIARNFRAHLPGTPRGSSRLPAAPAAGFRYPRKNSAPYFFDPALFSPRPPGYTVPVPGEGKEKRPFVPGGNCQLPRADVSIMGGEKTAG